MVNRCFEDSNRYFVSLCIKRYNSKKKPLVWFFIYGMPNKFQYSSSFNHVAGR
ncbi:hypothetical protein HanRHA438_Chr15g0700551 [Helianthus annuus]|nr:hypothetical protein HanRHA438_Chr15g0700551 [Helianthus annuus]